MSSSAGLSARAFKWKRKRPEGYKEMKATGKKAAGRNGKTELANAEKDKREARA